MLTSIFAVMMLAGTSVVNASVPVEQATVIALPQQSQSAIFDKTQQWFQENFVSENAVIEYESREAGVLIANGVATIDTEGFGTTENQIYFYIKIDIVAGKLTASTKVIKHMDEEMNGTYDVTTVSKAREEKATAYINQLISKLRAYVTQ